MKRRLKRLLLALVVLAMVGVGLYAASWLNARRLFLEVGPAEVSVAKGRMLPFGREAFVPLDPTIRKAYRSFPLPGGMKLGRGVTVFDDRVELDQALFRLLVDAAEFSLEVDNARTIELLPKYLEQMKAIPGVSSQQQLELQGIEREASYVRGRQMVGATEKSLEEAIEQFAHAASGRGSRHVDADARAAHLRRVLRVLREGVPKSVAEPPADTSTTTTGTVTMQ
ncbi:MAG: hypothetical protein AAGD10_05325 [Myxococcota bacterium]